MLANVHALVEATESRSPGQAAFALDANLSAARILSGDMRGMRLTAHWMARKLRACHARLCIAWWVRVWKDRRAQRGGCVAVVR